MVSIARAEQINGWMSSCELEWLACHASVRAAIVEVGCWHGRTTRALADNTSGTVYAVDTFAGSLDDDSMLFQVRQHPEGWVLDEFKSNTSDCKNIEIVHMTSLQAADKFWDKKFDMIFIDGEHAYESVSADIAAWIPLLSQGGLFCGHDYNFKNVSRAVQEQLGKVNTYSNIWYIE